MLLITKLASVNLLRSDVAYPVASFLWGLLLPTLIYDRWSDNCSLLVDCGGKFGAVKTWSLVYYPFNAWPSARGAGRARVDGKLSLRFCASLPSSIIIFLNFPLPQKFSHFREARSLRSKGLLDVHTRNLEIDGHRLTDTRFELL